MTCFSLQANPSPPFTQPSPPPAAASVSADPDDGEDAMDWEGEDAMDWEEAPTPCSSTSTSGSAGSDTLMYCHTLQFVSFQFVLLFLTLSCFCLVRWLGNSTRPSTGFATVLLGALVKK